MKIAICDDNKDELIRISAILNDYIKERKATIFYKSFYSATELLCTTKSGSYDLYLLDILMPALNGIDTAKEIRSFDKVAKIAFLTSSPEFAIDSYAVKASNYVLKPLTKEKLFFTLDEIIESTSREQEAAIIVKNSTSIVRIPLSQLTYVETLDRRVLYYLASGEIVEAVSQFSEVCEELLMHREFIQSHRSYLVNMNYINTIKNTEIQLQTQRSLPVSKRRVSEIKERYLTFQMEE